MWAATSCVSCPSGTAQHAITASVTNTTNTEVLDTLQCSKCLDINTPTENCELCGRFLKRLSCRDNMTLSW